MYKMSTRMLIKRALSKAPPLCILGIDPGYICTGYAILQAHGQQHKHCDSGVIRLSGSIESRFNKLLLELKALIEHHHPNALALETPFFHRDASATLKLGYICGALIALAVQHDLSVTEYKPRFIKKTIVGNGNATKQQVCFMVARLLQIPETQRDDESDAIAVALCHAYSQGSNLTRYKLQ